MKHSRGESLSATFGALSGAQFMHTICRFKAWEVINPMLQTVCDSELKWRSYSHWKPITPSWRQISQGCEISLWLWNGVLHAAKFRNPLARLWNSPEASQYLWPTFWDFFALDIWCLNPQTLLVIHLSQDSLVFKQEQRVNNPIFNACKFPWKERRKLVHRQLCIVFEGSKIQGFCSTLPTCFDCIYLFNFSY